MAIQNISDNAHIAVCHDNGGETAIFMVARAKECVKGEEERDEDAMRRH